jgi:N-methylhydantoinase A
VSETLARQSQVAGIDVGGTFTDLVLFDATHGTVRLAKTPTTLDNQAFGVLNALDAAEADIAALDLIVMARPRQPTRCWNAICVAPA